MSHKPTPGPWHLIDTIVYAVETIVVGNKTLSRDRFYAKVGGPKDTPIEELQANARLMAMAPIILADLELTRAALERERELKTELLVVCELAKKYLEPDLVEPGRTVFWKLVKAIAKAKGEPEAK